MKKLFITIIIVLILIQFIPYGKNHTNPKVISEPNWDSNQTRALFMKACGNCHSHETKWPSYSTIAPISWLIYHDVMEAREHFNVSAWGVQEKNHGKDAAKELEKGSMPPLLYLLAHPEAKLKDKEKKELIEGLKKTFGSENNSL